MNILIVLGIFLLVVASFTLILYYFKNQEGSCTASPFVYGAKQLEEQYGMEAYGVASLKPEANQVVPIFVFNSENISVGNG